MLSAVSSVLSVLSFCLSVCVRATVTDRYKVFIDLFNMSTYLLPTQHLPTLPAALRRKLLFVEEAEAAARVAVAK